MGRNPSGCKKLGKFEQVEVPTDKAGLLDFLNGNKDVGATSPTAGDAIPAEVVWSGSATSSPLAYIKDNIGVSEITNLYSSFRDAYTSIQHIMSVLAHTPEAHGLISDEARESFEKINDKASNELQSETGEQASIGEQRCLS